MESHEKPNYKYFDKDEDKPYFAAYLNTAKTNLFIILRDISEKLGQKRAGLKPKQILKKKYSGEV